MKTHKNIDASVKARLLNYARASTRPFQEVLQYYGMERFLYRLSLSEYANEFVLKGALLFHAWNLEDGRATRDIDMLACVDHAADYLERVVHTVCRVVVEDGIVFQTETIKTRRLQVGKGYEGLRVSFQGNMERTRVPMQIDFGYGDVITPAPQRIVYPGLLDLPRAEIWGYPPETVVAEKVHAMIEKGMQNSRIKDYYDLWVLFRWGNISTHQIGLAIEKTFARRKHKFSIDLFSQLLEKYAGENGAVWDEFYAKHASPDDRAPTFPAVCAYIFERVAGVVAVGKYKKDV